jgi:hypothetical protein
VYVELKMCYMEKLRAWVVLHMYYTSVYKQHLISCVLVVNDSNHSTWTQCVCLCVCVLHIWDLFCNFIEIYKQKISCTICLFLLLPWICKYVTKAIECVTSHKWTNMHNFYSVKYC